MRGLLLSCGLALGAAAPAAAAAGSTVMEFLRLDVGARQVGMGGAGVGLGGDVYSMAQNPAWLARLAAREAGFSYVSWFQDVTYQDMFYASPSRFGALGLRLQNLGYGDIQGYDAAGAPAGAFTASDRLLGAAWARDIPGRRAAAGVMWKTAQEAIGDAKATASMLDAGALWFPSDSPRLDTLSLGLALRNMGPSTGFDQGGEPLPRVVDLGAGMSFLDEALAGALDVRLPLHDSPGVALGAEYWVRGELALRMGFQSGQGQGPGLRAGLGFRVRSAQVDYALAPMGDLGMTHHVGLVVRFGGAAQAAFRQGVGLMRENHPAEAILKFDEALRLDPAHPEAGMWMRRAYRRIEGAVQEAR